jgi:uncharacterized protein (DUF697 family)
MASTKQRVHEIIHDAALACASLETGSAHVSGSLPEAGIAIQTKMIGEIASAYGIDFAPDAASDLQRTLLATMQSRQSLTSRNTLVGWLPGFDSETGDSAAAALTEAIGWAASAHFDKTQSR